MIGQFMSHIFGCMIAVAVVGTLILTLYLSSDAYAVQNRQQELNAMSIDDLEALLLSSDSDATAQDRIDAVMALGSSKDDLERRVRLLARATSINSAEYNTAARIGLQNLGAPAIEVLRTMMESGDFDGETRWACGAAKALGPVADPLMPELLKMLASGNPQARTAAIFPLQTLSPSEGVKAMEYIMEALDNDNFNVQCAACRAIERIGPEASEAVPQLVRLNQEGNTSTKSWAAVALGAIGPVQEVDTVDILVNNLDRFTHTEKERALIGLANMGRAAEHVVDRAREIMNASDKRSSVTAAWTVYRLTEVPDEPVTVLRSLLEDRSYRMDAAAMLGNFGADAAPATDDLINLLNHHDESVRENAIISLGQIGPDAAKAVEHIKRLESDTDALIRQAAAEAIERIENPTTDQRETEAADSP